METTKKAFANLIAVPGLNAAIVAADITAERYRALSFTQITSAAAHPFHLEVAQVHGHHGFTDVSSGGINPACIGRRGGR